MQAKKRAKPVKFGRKPEQPHAAENHDKHDINGIQHHAEPPGPQSIHHEGHGEQHETVSHTPEQHSESYHEKHHEVEAVETVQESGPHDTGYGNEASVDRIPEENVATHNKIAEEQSRAPEESYEEISHKEPVVSPVHIQHEPVQSHVSPHGSAENTYQEREKINLPDEQASSDKETQYASQPKHNTPQYSPVQRTEPSGSVHYARPVTQSSGQIETQSSPIEPAEEQIPTLGGDTYIVEKEVKKSVLGYFFLIAIISFIVGLITMAGVSYFLPKTQLPGGIPFVAAKPTVTTAPEPTSTPTPTPKPVDLTSRNIEVFNGSGVTGAATKLKTSLTDDGFKVTSAANADNTDYTDTIIYTPKNIEPEFTTKLEESLKKTYTFKEAASKPTIAASEEDVVIIIGTKTVETPAQ